MGTKPCPDCGSQVSEAAGNCPICRRFLTHRSLEMVSRGVFFLTIILLMVFDALRS